MSSVWTRPTESGIPRHDFPVGDKKDLKYFQAPFPRPNYANGDGDGPIPFFLPAAHELQVADYLPDYKLLTAEAAKDEFDLQYFVTARQTDVFRIAETSGWTQTLLAELILLHDLMCDRTRSLIAKLAARAGHHWQSSTQVESAWKQRRFELTYVPYITTADRAAHKKQQELERAAETTAFAKATASARVAERLASQRKRAAETAKRKGNTQGGAGS